MPEHFRPRVKNSKNSEPNENAKSKIDSIKPTETHSKVGNQKAVVFFYNFWNIELLMNI